MPAYFTYITPSCEKEARRYGVWADVQKLSQKIESTQDVGNLSFFPRIFRKKNLGKSYRLVIGEVPYAGDVDANLLVFWHVWPRSSSDYSKFLHNSQRYEYEREFKRYLDKLTPSLVQIIEDKLQSVSEAVLPKDLSKEEYEYLYGGNTRDDPKNNWIVLESETWIERTDPQKSSEPNNLSTRLSILYDLVVKAVQNAQNGDSATTFLRSDNGTAILYKALYEQKQIFLIAPLRADDQDDRAKLEERYRNVLNATRSEVLDRHSRRSYPYLILADSDLWERIQKTDEKANLALSDEEAKVLQKSRKGHYPLFINGRPGSGKSTILQYLFAEHLHDYLPLADKLQAPPLYLTYSQDLLETARNNVEAILKSNAYHRSRENPPDLGEIGALLQTSFYTLKDYLYKLLPESKKEAFPEKGYLRFPEFRLWYERTFGRDASFSDISAELAWHVIRSYIKGLSSETGEYLDDVDEFKELPGFKSVTADTFKRVAQQIWPRYQAMCQENHHWDDQDLVREILTAAAEKEIAIPEHVAVFCDEAQDYSLNELRFIFRLSLYTRRRLTPDVLNRLPFAFAGDPFQTLNPTGFDWNTIRGNFGLIIRDLLYSKGDSPPVLQPQNLKFNYRSSADIVQLCNVIHLMRGVAFKKKGLEPQEAWFVEVSRTPVYFDAESEVFQSMIQEQQETVIILPCQEGEEQRFVQSDPFLSRFGLKDGVIARNILSPMRAKGLEYQRVVLYKFGDTCIREYPGLLDLLSKKQSQQDDDDPEQWLPLEYFVNRLYVAASRARRRLLIVDTKQGLENFWKKYFEKTDLQQWIDDYRAFNSSSKWSVEHIGKIQAGRQEDWQDDRDDPLQLAKDFESRGIANKDPYMLQLAARNYRHAKHETKALRCDAYRLEFEEKLIEAGKIWQDLGEQEKAKELYWKAKAFEHLAAFEDQSLQKRVAQFMLGRKEASFQDVRNLLEDIGNALDNSHIEPDPVWQDVISTLYQDLLSKSRPHDLRPFEWERLWKRACDLHKKGLLNRDEEVNQLHLRATPYPEKLTLLHRYKQPAAKIVELYKTHPDEPLNETQVNIVFQALQTSEEDEELERLVARYPAEHRLIGMLVYSARRKKDATRIWAEKLLAYWVQNAQWKAALDFAKGRNLDNRLNERDAKAVREYQWEKYEIDVPLIRLLSVSDALSKADTPEKNLISRYLRDTLIKRPDFFSQKLTVQQAGGALERAGKVMDCLDFYEMVFKQQTWPANEEDKTFARERWLVCKRRQIAITTDDQRKKKIQREIENRAREWNIDLDRLPEYPVVDVKAKPKPVRPKEQQRIDTQEGHTGLPSKTFSSSDIDGLIKPVADVASSPGGDEVQKRQKKHEQATLPKEPSPIIKIQFGVDEQRFQCKMNRSRGKMTLQLVEEMGMVTLLAQGLVIQGSDEEMNAQIETVHQDNSRAEYFIQPWNVTVVLRRGNRHRNLVYVILFLGRGHSKFELLSLRLAE